jgi:hypothetical protein
VSESKQERESKSKRESEQEQERPRESKGGRATERGTAAERGNSVGKRKTPKRVRPGPGCDWNRMEVPGVLHHTQKPDARRPSLRNPDAGV